jgi:transcriptional regulator GlxA family with amidase domain
MGDCGNLAGSLRQTIPLLLSGYSGIVDMKHVSILVPAGDIILSSVVGPFKVLNWVNQYNAQQGLPPLFEVHLVGLAWQNGLYGGLFSVNPDKLADDIDQTDLIIIPAMMDLEGCMKQSSAFVPWILKHRKSGTEVASLCTGAFLLAETGLLDGRHCTTHWQAADAFTKRYPKVHMIPDKIIIDEQGIYSSGGAFSFLNLVLYLVEKFAGKETAIAASKMFEIEYGRSRQSEFAIFLGQKDHQDEQVLNAQTYIEQNWQEKINIEELAARLALSRRNFERRFRRATANSPVEYIQRVKMEVAKKSLEIGRENINEVMYKVGYNDSKAFRDTFRRVTGLSPIEYRNKYQRA